MKTYITTLLLAYQVCDSSAVGDTYFQRLERVFKNGHLPQVTDLIGHTWTGSVVRRITPNLLVKDAVLPCLHEKDPIFGDAVYAIPLSAPSEWLELDTAALEGKLEKAREMIRTHFRPKGLTFLEENLLTNALESRVPGFSHPSDRPGYTDYQPAQLYRFRLFECNSADRICLILAVVCDQGEPIPEGFELTGKTGCGEGGAYGEVERYIYFSRK